MASLLEVTLFAPEINDEILNFFGLVQFFQGDDAFNEGLELVIEKAMIPMINMNFFTQGDYAGQPWPPLSDWTINSRLGMTSSQRQGLFEAGGMTPSTNLFRGQQFPLFAAPVLTFAFEVGAKQLPALEDTGRMREAATSRDAWTVDSNEAIFGNWPSDRWWAGAHEFGFTTSLGTVVPARPFAIVNEFDEESSAEIMLEWLEEEIERRLGARFFPGAIKNAAYDLGILQGFGAQGFDENRPYS